MSGADISVDYDISVPEDINLDIENTDGPIYVTGNRGSEKISTIDGNIELKDIAGSISARTIDGDIHVEALFDAESSFGTTEGSIDICIGDDFSVPISAHTISGAINITIPAGTVIAAGSVVRKTIQEPGIYEGNPAKKVSGL